MAKKSVRRVAESYRNAGNPWTAADVQRLRQLARENTPTRVIGLKLGRTPGAVQSKASAEKISLAPPNQSPFGTAKGRGTRSGSRTARKSSARRR